VSVWSDDLGNAGPDRRRRIPFGARCGSGAGSRFQTNVSKTDLKAGGGLVASGARHPAGCRFLSPNA
jgi:hypothetical protein